MTLAMLLGRAQGWDLGLGMKRFSFSPNPSFLGLERLIKSPVIVEKSAKNRSISDSST